MNSIAAKLMVAWYFATIMVVMDAILIPFCTKPVVKHFKPMKIA